MQNAESSAPVDLGSTTSIDVLNGLVALDDKVVLDVGCGDMTFSRSLAGAGARVLAIDPDPVQAEANRAVEPCLDLDFVEAGAERLPVRAASADGICFSFSLHHVPAALYPDVFAEVARCLKPTGFLCVIEPLCGPLGEVVRLFHDERHEQAEAQRALVRLAVPAFESHSVLRYHSQVEYESFAAFVERYTGRTYNEQYTEADIRRPEIEALFERLGRPTYRFDSPKQMMFLRGPKQESSAPAGDW